MAPQTPTLASTGAKLPPARVASRSEATRIVFVVPLLVAALGAALMWLGQSALEASNRDLARSQFVAHSRTVAWTIDTALDQADPLRERLKEIALSWQPTDDPAPHAYELSDLILARPGVAYTSVSFTDGTFAGVFLEDEGRAVRFQVSKVAAPDDTRVWVYDPTSRAGLPLVREERSTYDPRGRAFYKLAVGTQGPVWTDPYPFFKTNVTGITLTEAVYRRDRPSELHAVITIDFDIEALSSAMSQTPQPDGATLVLHAEGGTILAAPGLRERYPDLHYPADRPLAVTDLEDPVLRALASGARGEDASVWSFDQGKVTYLAASERVGKRHGLRWFASMSVGEQKFLAALPGLQQRSFVASAVALGVALVVSLWFARHLTKARREAQEAREQAKVAEGRVQELGSYRLIARIAHGGMGEVWRAEHRLLARPAAIKLIRADISGPEGQRVAEERFRREAETLAGLTSRNTVQIFDYGVSDDGTFYLVMELLDGIDLDRLVSIDGPQPAARVISILLQALSSLREAHQAGLVHRDIKPGNLFLSRAAEEFDILKVLDFGVVRATASEELVDAPPTEDSLKKLAENNAALTTKDGYLGTPGYMAPEQIRHQPLDGRTDLYSLGCVAYFLLTGEAVFAGPNAMNTMVAHMTKTPPSPREKAHGWLPEGLESVIKDCLAKDPTKRPASDREVAQRLRAIEIPEQHAWSAGKAETWWEALRQEGQAEAGTTRRLVVARDAP